MDNYQEQRLEPHLSVPLRIIDIDEYIAWLGTPECKVWHVMARYIIRAPTRRKLGKKIYDTYYKNGKLAMTYKLEAIAKKSGLKSKGYVSDIIQNMVQKGYIKRHNDKWFGRSIVVYELGIHDQGTNRHETLHLHTKIVERCGKSIIDRFRNSEL